MHKMTIAALALALHTVANASTGMELISSSIDEPPPQDDPTQRASTVNCSGGTSSLILTGWPIQMRVLRDSLYWLYFTNAVPNRVMAVYNDDNYIGNAGPTSSRGDGGIQLRAPNDSKISRITFQDMYSKCATFTITTQHAPIVSIKPHKSVIEPGELITYEPIVTTDPILSPSPKLNYHWNMQRKKDSWDEFHTASVDYNGFHREGAHKINLAISDGIYSAYDTSIVTVEQKPIKPTLAVTATSSCTDKWTATPLPSGGYFEYYKIPSNEKMGEPELYKTVNSADLTTSDHLKGAYSSATSKIPGMQRRVLRLKVRGCNQNSRCSDFSNVETAEHSHRPSARPHCAGTPM